MKERYMRDYAKVVKSLDDNVGRVLDYLEEKGLDENTLVVYTSDQGFYMGEHGWFDKRFMYEECLRMPFVIRYPKMIKAGSTSKAICMNVDFGPTFLDLAGIEVPSEMQGRSFRKVLEKKGRIPAGWREAAYYHYYEYPAEHSVKRHYGIRTSDCKLIHFYNDIDQWEMYDMKADPQEMRNVYDDPTYADKRAQMHRILEQVQQEYEDTDPCEKEHALFRF